MDELIQHRTINASCFGNRKLRFSAGFDGLPKLLTQAACN